MNKENEFDDLFKSKLAEPVEPQGYNEDDWGALEQMLDKGKKRRGLIFWLPVYGSAAALLLLFLGYLAFRQHAGVKPQPINPQAVNQPKVHSGNNDGPIRQQTIHSTKTTAPGVIAATGTNQGRQNTFLPFSAGGARRTAGPVLMQSSTGFVKPAAEELADVNPVAVFPQQHLVADQVAAVNLQAISVTSSTHDIATATNPPAIPKKKVVVKQGYRPQFALSVLAAPDINGVGSFAQSKVGTNEGLLFSAGISKRFTLSTGVIYSAKPYMTNFSNYHTAFQFATNPVNVTADCRMLDIPLNINYRLYSKHQNTFSLGTGLSSYIMLHESYKFNYNDTYTTGPAQYNVPSPNQYFFGVLNLNATYQHQVNQKMGFSIQPYVKLPLTNIGYSQVRLQTTGVALGLTWNINSLSRP
jgi:hypothetical protein